ncbi:uncharacterized protein Dwil_GK11916 [Drosophila willistoni]|uniref:Uncharacterized protein n=1 Tax=Drosophila willistoni TaxID=7260 RepID=B4NBK5_DROWI|nr:uncharacterized protein LOC6647619 [Drosophila willistoni]XP_046869542.1 uncharacterized protein LOC6647619 [Drosophila willistoni]EDW81169.1 uncharacterized protein Dwil_GK11916 [Drosophila willistoni]
MFKKAKPQIEPPPTAPTVDEMQADMETFVFTQPSINSSGNTDNADLEHTLLTEPESLALPTWWQVFDEYDQKVRKMAAMEEKLVTQRDRLLACQAKLDENAQQLRDGIQRQQTSIKEVVKV